MKILHVNCSETGSTGKIIHEISKESYERGYQSILCAPKINDWGLNYLKKYQTSKRFEQGLYRRIGRFFGNQYGFAPLSTLKIKKIIKKENPDVVHLHCINGYMVNVFKLLSFLKKRNVRTVVTNHAEFFYTGNCAYSYDCERWKVGCGNCPTLTQSTGSRIFDTTSKSWKKMKKSFKTFNSINIVSVSPWSEQRVKESEILKNCKNYLIENGIDLGVFCKNNIFNGSDKKIVLQVTSLFSDKDTNYKGGKYLVDLANRFLEDNVEFVVAGRTTISSDLPVNIKFLGRVSNQQELSKLYQNADVTLLTSKRETFGMAVAESLSCGTPVVGFKSGGSESIAIEGYSKFVEFGDVDGLEKALREYLGYKNESVANEISKIATERYDSKIMAKKYNDLYEKLV